MSDEKIERLARGELSPLESRELARKALDNPELFEELTSIALANQAVTRQALAGEQHKKRMPPRILWLAAAAAVVILGVVLAGNIRSRLPQPRPQAATDSLPIFLARNVDSAPATFRDAQPESRAPRITGSVVSVAAAIASVDVGSVDGLEKGSEVEIRRDGRVIGKVVLTFIFRESARGKIASGSTVRINDQVRIPAAVYLRAVLDQIDAMAGRGDLEGAREIAQHATVEDFDSPGASEQDLNNAGIIAELHADREKAAELYYRALRSNPPERDRQTIEKNLVRVKAGH